MQIQRIKATNFKTYLSLDLDLQVEDECPIILIGGNNGGGSSGGGGGQQVNPSSGGWTWPTPGCYNVLSPFGEDRGYSHQGIDIGAPMGATVVAAKGGTVITSNNSCTHNYGKSGSCGCGGGFGNYIIIDHGGGYSTTYGHLTSANVSTGQSVSAGQQS